ncbi:MAG: hypothetical protein Q9168_002014 [Polycauliona sp. 1 TL-2023]
MNGTENPVNGNDVGANSKIRMNGNETEVNGNSEAKATAAPSAVVINGMKEQLYVFSAQSLNSLEAYLSSFAEYLEEIPESAEFAKDLAYTLGERRTHFAHRAVVVADSTKVLKDQLQSLSKISKSGKTKDPVVAFTFTGQGAQYFQMSAGLQGYREFAETILAAEHILLDLGAKWSLSEELDKGKRDSRVDDAEISQPACTAVQLALVVLLRSWGIFPAVVVGHSSGEIAAAFTAGLVSFQAAMAIAYFRGIAAKKIVADSGVKGAMLALGTGPEEAKKLLDNSKGYAVVAAVNSPGSVTISGDAASIQHTQEMAEKQGLFVRRLKVGVAYHSQHMARVADSYLASIKSYCSDDLKPTNAEPTKPLFISSVTGAREAADTVGASYWVKNLLQPVLYLQAVEALFSDRGHVGAKDLVPDVMVEIGPHPALQSATKQILERIASGGQNQAEHVKYLPSLVRVKDATTSLLSLAASLFAAGSDLNLATINQTGPSQVHMLDHLPPYEWNKTARYIHQSRIAAKWLHQGGPYHSLLGWKSPYTEGNEHAFRNVFTLDDLPWIRDHVIAGRVLFPFTAFLSLAVEAFRSLSPTLVPAVLIREFHITASLEIDEDQPVDLTTKFRPAATGSQTVSSTAWTFEILSWSDSHEWIHHSSGLIDIDHSHESLPRSPHVQSALKILNSSTLQPHDAQDEYTRLKSDHRLAYGPTFRNMTHLRTQQSSATVATIALRQLENDPHTHQGASPVAVDPPTLDSIFHTIGALIGTTGPGPTMVPSSCQAWRISNRIAADVGRLLAVVCTVLDRDEKSSTMQIQYVIFDVSTPSSPPKAIAEIGPIKWKCFDQPDTLHLGLPDSYVIKHVPYTDLIDPRNLSGMIQATPAALDELQVRRDLDRTAIHFLSRMLKEIANDDLSTLPVHHVRFLAWARRVVEAQQPAIRDSAAAVDKVSSSGTREMICAIGAQLPQIIRGQQQALNIMLQDNLLQRCYEQYESTNRVNQVAANYVGRLAACNPEVAILEIGGGTASATLPILESVQRATEGLSSSCHYTFTDISAGFFDNARTKLSRWTEQLTYRKLDISQDPLAQGFVAESYDIVLASNVLHATPDIVATLKNARAMLKPNGKLVLVEAILEAPPHFVPFVLLEGWWLSEDSYRSPSDGPLLTKRLWNDLLMASGFAGVEGFADDYPGQPENLFSTMWSTKSDSRGATGKSNVDVSTTVYHSLSHDDINFTESVANDLTHQLGCRSIIKHRLEDGNDEKTPTWVVLDSQKRSMLSDPSSAMFHNIKELLMHVPNVLWVLPDRSHPDASIIKGLLSSLRMEIATSKFVLLEAPFCASGSGAIAQVAKHLILDPYSTINNEQVYSVIDGIIHVPRLQLAEAGKETFITEAGGSVKKEQSIWHQNNALEMTLDTAGSPDSLYFRHSDILATDLGAEEIIVRVEAVGLNFRDLLLVLGSLPWHAPGLEGAGVVTRVGSRVTDLHVGDHVFYIVHEAGMANFVRIPSLRAHRLPRGLNMIDAASLPIAYSTAIMSIVECGRLRKGQSILVHSATGAVGQACIMIARHIGARIFATAGSAEKREFLAQTCGVPTAQIFSSRTSEFKDEILQATDGRGVDLVINSLSGLLLQQTWDLTAENGTFVEIGKKDLLENSYLPMKNFDKNITFSAIDLRKVANARPDAVREWLSNIVLMIESRNIMPIRPVTSVPISSVKKGLRKLQSGQNIGKIVATVEDESVMVERLSPLKARSGNLLHPDATYLISGGTGGIGRALAQWMIRRGARYLVLLGRSGASSPRVKELLQRYDGTDVCLRALACDVSSRSDIILTVAALRDLPKVCGVIHGALQERDVMFANATLEDWQHMMGPKVKGAWHLHEFFPNLDFFVSLSSLLGVFGRIGTSLYAAAASFLDAFSEHRNQLGLPAVTVDLPIVEGIGLVVDRGIFGQLKASLGVTITADQLYTLVEGAIIGPSSGLNAHGRSLSWTLASKKEINHLAWEHISPLSVMRRLRIKSGGVNSSSDDESKKLQDLLKDGSPELLDALGDKVSSITMIDRDDITPERSLLDYGLDSLFSMELRNWIRRRFNIDMALKDITSAKSLKALVERITPQMRDSVAASTLSQNQTPKVEAAPRVQTPDGDAAEAGSKSDSSNHPLDSVVFPKLPLSPLLGVRDEERGSIQEHLQSIGIDVSNVELVLPCAPVQVGILFAQLRNQARQYFECMTLRLTSQGVAGDVDIDKVAAAWRALCVAQPMLRTVFTSSPSSVGAFQQIILKRTDPPISRATVDPQAGLASVLETMEEPQLAAAQPPHHLHLTRVSSSVVYASFYLNHALFDGRSFRLVSQQLRQAYTDLASIPRGLDMSAHLSWVRNHPAAVKDYWKSYLSGTRPCFISLLNGSESSLLDRTLPPYVDIFVNPRILFHSFCRQQGVTVANLVQVAWGIVVRQINGSQSVTFGCGQSQIGAVEGDETMLGPLLTNMICRFNVGLNMTLVELLKQAREDSLHALELPSYSMAELHETIGLGQFSLFDTAMTIIREPPATPTTADGIQAEWLRPDESATEYAITVGVAYDNDKIECRLYHDVTRVSRSLAEKIGSLFEKLIIEIVNDADQSIQKLESSISKPAAAFSAQDVARSIYREAASQCELATGLLEDIYPCSPLQQHQVQASAQQKSGGCMDQYVFRVPEQSSAIKLYEALDIVAAASPALRTRFVSLKQRGIFQVTVKATPSWNSETSLSDYLQWDRGFQIRYGGPMCRFGEVEEPDGKRYLVLSLHPAIYDPWSLDLILTAVSEVYEDDNKSPDPFQSFGTYLCRLSDRNIAEDAQKVLPAQPQWSHEAPSQFPIVPHDVSDADLSHSRSLAVPLPLSDIGKDIRTTLAVLPAAWALCLSRLNGEGKACFGMYVNRRDEPVEGIARITGPIGAVVPCAVDLTTLDTGHSLLGAVRDNVKAATPSLQALHRCEASTSDSTTSTSNAFTNVLIVHQEPASVTQTGPPEILELVQTRLSEGSFDGARLITRCRAEPSGRLSIEMQFDSQVVSVEDIDILLQQYKHAITQLVLQGSAPLASMDPVSSYERSLLLTWNTNSPIQVDACIQDQIRDVAKVQPLGPAVCSWDGELNHEQLDDLSDRVAALLRQNGVKVGTIVPYFCEKSAAAAVVMLGIVKAGGALVGMDSDHPAQRLSNILAQVGASTVIISTACHEKVKAKVTVYNTVLVDMGLIRKLPSGGLGLVSTKPSDTCIVQYTSGSTGSPKGVVISHANFATSVHHVRKAFGMAATTRTLQFSNFIYDAALYDVFMTLVSGGCVCVPQEAERLNDIPGAIARTRANFALLSPSTASLLSPAEVPTLRTLCIGGENFPRDMKEKWKNVCLINAYGPSEATVVSSLRLVSRTSGKHHLNIGRPIACRYWVVDPDNHNQLVPVGCPGELLIQGPNVAQGYFKDAQKTKEAFIEPPNWISDFTSLDLTSNQWYKTGDLVMQMADGSVTIHGRKGNQIKLAGQRIELEDIEHHLGQLSDPSWKLVVELIKPSEQGRDSCLAMFFTVPAAKDKASGPEDACQLLPALPQKASMLRQALLSKLPAFMVPQYFIHLNRLPLTSSSKTDRQALRKLGTSIPPERLCAYSGLGTASSQVMTPQEVINGESKVKPDNTAEVELRRLWARTLALPPDRLKTTDNFFSLGGSSIRAMRLVNAARRAGFAVTVTDVFSTPIFSDLAAAMRSVAPNNDGTSREKLTPAPQAASSRSTAISSSLRTCLTEHGLSMENIESVVPATDVEADQVALSELDGDSFKSTHIMEFTVAGLDGARITRACEMVIRDHVVMRTIFVQHGSSLQQVVLRSPPKGGVQVSTSEEDAEQASGNHVKGKTVIEDSLAHFQVQVRGGRCHKLRLKFHHALFEAISLDHIWKSLNAIYSQQSLVKSPSFHAWVSHVESLDKAPSRKFWTQALRGSSISYLVPPPTGLRPTSGSPCSDSISIQIPLETTSYATSANMVQAAWALVLSHTIGQQDVVFGTTNHNRDPVSFPDVDRVAGPCLNIVPVRAQLDKCAALGDLVAQIQTQAVGAMPHQHLGFRDIIRTCTDWPASRRFGSLLLYQVDDALPFAKASMQFADVDCTFTYNCPIGQIADVYVQATANASMDALMIKMCYSQDTLPEDQARLIIRLLQTVLETMPKVPERPLREMTETMDEIIPAGSITSVPNQPGPAANGVLQDGIALSNPPSALTLAIVSQAWDDVGLVVPPAASNQKGDDEVKEDRSMFSNDKHSADLVITLLLSRYYQRNGYKLSMQELIDHPTQNGQASLLETLKE